MILLDRSDVHLERQRMSQQLRIAIASGPDVDSERRLALDVIARVNERFRDRIDLSVVEKPTQADLALVLAWNEADGAFETEFDCATQVAHKLLLLRTDAVTVSLGDREEVLRRLRSREKLEELLDRHSDEFQLLRFSGDPVRVLERELSRIVEVRLGEQGAPVDQRLRLGSGFVERSRLLRLLPDTPGHVVVLEAPYGTGKSVLAAQWAEHLEREGYRVVWAPRTGPEQGLMPALAFALAVSEDTPAALLRERLWQSPTLVVAEDLDPEDDLTPLLEDPQGLVLLASRGPLTDEGLQRLEAQGRVTRLRTADLAFTREETIDLFGQESVAARHHASTLGWALPLHLSAITGSGPSSSELVEGVRESVSEGEWEELLFLAALPHLPISATTPATESLASRGFVQTLGNAFRLHPWLSDLLQGSHGEAVYRTVRRNADRLPLEIRGEAFESTGDWEKLAEVLVAAVDVELWRTAPHRLVAWDRLVPGLSHPRRDWAVGSAYGRLGEFEPALERLRSALAAPGTSATERLAIAREMCVPLAVHDPEAGRELIEGAEAWIAQADPETAARFLGNAAILHAHAGEADEALRLAERALQMFPEGSPHRLASEVNFALFRWDLAGDFDARLEMQISTLDRVASTYPVQFLGQCRDLGMFHLWLGDRTAAIHYLKLAAEGEDRNPSIATEARAALAYLAGDREEVGRELRRALTFPNPYVADIVSMHKILLDIEAADLAGAARTFRDAPQGTFAACAYARVLAEQGDREGALALLTGVTSSDRARRLYLEATRYLITREAEALDAFLAVTTAGMRLLPGFFPLGTLPDDPRFAAPYPMTEVLRAGRVDAVSGREDEIPPLRLDLLGSFDVRVLGSQVELTGRHRQIITLFLLGLPREELAEAIWPEIDVRKQRNNLNVQLASLRKAIEPWGMPTYLSEAGLLRVESDYLELLQALDSCDVRRVLQVYREPLAPGMDLAPLVEERERLREKVIAVLAAGAEDPTIEEACLLRVLELEPLHEEILQRLLKGLVRRGRRREAIQRFRQFEERLDKELGLEPLPETGALLGY